MLTLVDLLDDNVIVNFFTLMVNETGHSLLFNENFHLSHFIMDDTLTMFNSTVLATHFETTKQQSENTKISQDLPSTGSQPSLI